MNEKIYKFPLLINGQTVETESSFDVLNPANESVIGQAPAATVEHLDKAVRAARTAFPAWSATPDHERAAALEAISASLKEHAGELAKLITLEQGKPLNGFAGKGAKFEVMAAAMWAAATSKQCLVDETLVDDDTAHIVQTRKPLGVVGSITPWNWPVMIAAWHILPALRTGNTVVLKPSSLTPLATQRFAQIVAQHLPDGVLNLITGLGGLGDAIATHPGIDKVVFTGSTQTGKSVMKSASDTLKRLTLELGGNDAGIVLPDADVQNIAPRIFGGAFSNSGQTCGALKRLYVHDSLYDDMCEALVALAGKMPVGNGLDEATMFGPLQNRAQFDYVRELADDAKAEGGRILTGGEAPDGKGYFFPITLVADISDGTRLVDEEQFGPILPIIRYTDVEDAIRRANDNPNGLGGSVWSQDSAAAAAVAKLLECGTAWINVHGGLNPNVPFGGVKQSGFGVEFGTDGLKEYTSIQILNTMRG